MRNVLVLNAKGGSGKTTIATNLAAYYAAKGLVTVLKDYDPQGSSMDWLNLRSGTSPRVYGVHSCKVHMHATQAWQTRLPPHVERIIIDSPAAVDLGRYGALLRTIDKIVVPVIPSPIDMGATLKFVRSLQQFIRTHPCPGEIGVVMNRVSTHQHQCVATLQRILAELNVTSITGLSDSQKYPQAAEHGAGLLETESANIEHDQLEWLPLLRWIDDEPMMPCQVMAEEGALVEA